MDRSEKKINDEIKIVAIGGAPGSGKTSLVKTLLGAGDYKEFRFNTLKGGSNGSLGYLGRYFKSMRFEGTDLLSMAVQPDAERFFTNVAGRLCAKWIFEGDRLFNSSFLGFLRSRFDTEIIVLECSPEILQSRQDFRSQTERFVKSRLTKLDNIKAKFPCKIHRMDDLEDSSIVVSSLKKILS